MQQGPLAMIRLLLTVVPFFASGQSVSLHHAASARFEALVAALALCNPRRSKNSMEGGSTGMSSAACVLEQVAFSC